MLDGWQYRGVHVAMAPDQRNKNDTCRGSVEGLEPG